MMLNWMCNPTYLLFVVVVSPGQMRNKHDNVYVIRNRKVSLPTLFLTEWLSRSLDLEKWTKRLAVGCDKFLPGWLCRDVA